jgi:hypothetical protein
MIDEGDIPSVQHKMKLKGHKSMRKANRLSLLFVNFYVPAPTSSLSSTETSLQLSENMPLFFGSPDVASGRNAQKKIFL